MNIADRHIKKVLRDKYRLRVGHVKTGPDSGRYKICRFNSNEDQVHYDRNIASELGVEFVEYRAYLLQGLAINEDYWVDNSNILGGNISFAEKGTCMAALYNLYEGLERRRKDESGRYSPGSRRSY